MTRISTENASLGQVSARFTYDQTGDGFSKRQGAGTRRCWGIWGKPAG
jgi:hypothetical protein